MTDTNTQADRILLESFVAFLRHAVTQRHSGHADACSIWLRAASHLHGIDGDSISALTYSLIRHGSVDAAISIAQCIAWLEPDSAAASFRLGYVLQVANRHGDAVAPYRHAMAIDADVPLLRNNLAMALRASGRGQEEEISLLESAVAADPTSSEPWINLAISWRTRLNLEKAIFAGAQAVSLVPDSPLALNNYALVLKEARRWEEAEFHAKRACEVAPNDASLRFNLAILHLARGNYADGWREHEARWDGSEELSGLRPKLPGLPWHGQSLSGKTLLVWGEQGMGDLLQCCRFIPMLANRVHQDGGRLVWNSFPQMGKLLARAFGEHVDAYTAGGGVEALPEFDYQVPLLSLPSVLGTGADVASHIVPYLRADRDAREAWRERLAAETRLKVGLAWTGSRTHQRNPFRRVEIERLASSFADIEGVAFYSLQPGAVADIAAAKKAGLDIVDYTAEFGDFDDTAAFVGALDLVVTVCTSVAHLSGALGQRTWVLLDVNPHWTWLLDRRETPWYPGARLYRQHQFAQWAPVLDEVRNDLSALAQARKSY